MLGTETRQVRLEVLSQIESYLWEVQPTNCQKTVERGIVQVWSRRSMWVFAILKEKSGESGVIPQFYFETRRAHTKSEICRNVWARQRVPYIRKGFSRIGVHNGEKNIPKPPR